MDSSIKDLFESIRDGSERRDMYNDLAPLYDFIYERHYDYENQYAFVRDIAPDGVSSVLEGACGAGRLTELLSEEYDVVGVDLNEGMLRQARERVPEVDFVRKDLRELDLGREFDVFVVLGASMIHMLEDGDVEMVVENAWEHLDDGGVFAFDFFPSSQFENGHTGESVFTGEDFEVTRNHLNVKCGEELYRLNFAFEIENLGSGGVVRTAESDMIRTFAPEYLEGVLRDCGFGSVEYCGSEKWSDGAELEDLMIAEK